LRIFFLFFFLHFACFSGYSQNPMYIPPALKGTTFNLDIKSGSTTFYSGISTPTYGVNGVWMAPTLIFSKGDSVTINVHNRLNTSTTIHWHGLHVPAKYDGGPHQVINKNTTWSPSFVIRNDAGTYWYHPHGQNKTDLHVSKGIAGMIIVRDSIEEALNLPRTYGKDDFPIIIQSKAFDVLSQIAIATNMDTAMFVNGTLKPFLDVPAQVVRLRLLNGSSMRTYNFGLSNNAAFKMIASDDGLLDSSISLNRIRLSPGERVEILVDLGAMKGQTFYLKNFGSELSDGIYGAKNVGKSGDTIPEYHGNFLNGKDYNILQLNVVSSIGSAITTMPSSLLNSKKLDSNSINAHRLFLITADSSNSKAEGPFSINNHKFDMDTINITTYKGNTEIWIWINKTLVAHPIHIHDIHFFILDINGKLPPKSQQGKKDVVLVLPGDTVRFLTKFEDFSDSTTPYMYHCHLLHHEDDGMMGSFLVLPQKKSGIYNFSDNLSVLKLYPNPASEYINLELSQLLTTKADLRLTDMLGRQIINLNTNIIGGHIKADVSNLVQGIYKLAIYYDERLCERMLIISK
jgi:blue copper oxidase